MDAAYGPRRSGLYAGQVSSQLLSSIRSGTTADTTPITLLHGFTQTAECWGSFADHLATSHPILAIDLPGHGGSAELRGDLTQSAATVASAITPSIVIGYSLGGRIALHLALAFPELVERLVLIGATGGIDNEDEREQRRNSDDALADRLEDIGIDAFLDDWLAQPLFASLTSEQSMREQRSLNSVAGLASSLRLCGTGAQAPLWDRLNELTMPVLVLAGSNDEKFTQLGHRLVASIGSNASFKAIAGSGHSTHLEDPSATSAAVTEWLSKTS
jgi:2-succinyl-6-hydroxy-2,4-cyclohexadiene-1-carboxylate synthase